MIIKEIKVSNILAMVLTLVFMFMGKIDPFYGSVMFIYFLGIKLTK